jgi:hypothetical protein
VSIILTTYKVKPYMSKAQTQELLRAYGSDYVNRPSPPLGDHYMDTSASSGVIIINNPSVEKMNWLLQMELAYREYVDFTQGVPLLSVNEAITVVKAAWKPELGPK